MDHHIEAVLALRDGDMLTILSTSCVKNFITLIGAIIEVEECSTIVLILLNCILYQHKADVE